jgi:prepilin-type N-terminal cleavage/methylation domain-containing protein
MLRNHPPQAGFTFIELVIVMVLLGILAATGSTMIADAMTAARLSTLSDSSGSQARYAMERIARELREIEFGTLGYEITTMSATALSFTKKDGTVVSITSSVPTLSMQYNPGATGVLTNQLSSIAFAYYDFDAIATTDKNDVRFIQVTLTVANSITGATDTQRTRVFLRNAI